MDHTGKKLSFTCTLSSQNTLQDEAADRYLDILQQARARAALFLRKKRGRSHHYSLHHLRKAKQRGFEEGRREAARHFASLLERSLYLHDQALAQARDLTVALATKAASDFIGRRMQDSPEPYVAWISKALRILKDTQQITLEYAESLAPLIQQISDLLPEQIIFRCNLTLKPGDMRLTSDSGAVEFAWASALAVALEEMSRT